MIRRREFITLAGGAAAWPLAARAQQGDRVRRLSVLMSLAENDPEAQARVAALTQGLRGLGWTEGRNLRMGISLDRRRGHRPYPGRGGGTRSLESRPGAHE